MLYRRASIEDFNQISLVHINSFKGLFLTELGVNFLNLYYKSVLRSESTISVCATDNELVIGFVVGCKQSKGYNKSLLLNNFFSFFTFTVITLFTKPKKIIRLIRNFSKIKKPSDDGIYSEILSIAVLPNYTGQGVGDKLVIEFEKIVKEENLKKITLTTDYYNNDSVISFYKKNGYSIFYDFITYPNRRMYKLIKNL
ncbi:GNAT family N-acetyltransferase [Bacteroidota bacterium]